jgi:hypothetical protein
MLSVFVWLTTRAIAAAAPAPQPELDTACVALREALRRELPMLRKRRVEVSGCARLPGYRAVVVLRSTRESSGDPLEIAAAPDRQRLDLFRTSWEGEPVTFVGDRGEPGAVVRDALAPFEIDRVVVHPGGATADVVTRSTSLPDPRMVAVTTAATGVQLRCWNPGSWTVARIHAAESLVQTLALDEPTTERLVDLGILSPTDLIGTPSEPLAASMQTAPGDVRAWTDAAAMWTEFTAAGHARGW